MRSIRPTAGTGRFAGGTTGATRLVRVCSARTLATYAVGIDSAPAKSAAAGTAEEVRGRVWSLGRLVALPGQPAGDTQRLRPRARGSHVAAVSLVRGSEHQLVKMAG